MSLSAWESPVILSINAKKACDDINGSFYIDNKNVTGPYFTLFFFAPIYLPKMYLKL